MKFNHLGFPIKSTQELAKSSKVLVKQAFSKDESDEMEVKPEIRKSKTKRKVQNVFHF